MFLADNHVHTRFSPDGHGEPEEFVLRAVKEKSTHLNFTEHADLTYYKPEFAHGDLDGYFSAVRALKKKHADEIYIGAGLEIGFTPENASLNAELIEKYRPDCVINSVHQVGEYDCYFPEYFVGKTPAEATVEYMRAVLRSLDAPYAYHVVAHFGYVLRNAPFSLSLTQIDAGLADEILRKIISEGKILELNTSCGKHAELQSVPSREILERYAALGGKKICLSSDAHYAQHLWRNFDFAASLAKECGFGYQTVVEYGKEISVPL